MALQQGSIVWVELVDPAGRNPKTRPAVVLTPSNEILPGGTIYVAAASSTFNEPLPVNQVVLPWHPQKHPVTGLRKKCVVMCEWIAEIDPAHILEIGGVCPPSHLFQILARLPKIPSRVKPPPQG